MLQFLFRHSRLPFVVVSAATIAACLLGFEFRFSVEEIEQLLHKNQQQWLAVRHNEFIARLIE